MVPTTLHTAMAAPIFSEYLEIIMDNVFYAHTCITIQIDICE